MQSKSLLIAIAAFAVTATGAQAFVSSRDLIESGLSETQVEALKEANDLRKEGKQNEAKNILLKAGIDEGAIDSVRGVMRQANEKMRQTLEDGDYSAFKEAIVGMPLADIITTEADFKEFVRAHNLKITGRQEEAKVIFTELGLPEAGRNKGFGFGREFNLTEEQRDALRTARQANDIKTVKEILKEAGLDENELKNNHIMRHNINH